MKYVLYLRNDAENIRNKVKNEDIAYEVVDSVVTFWNMARIKTKQRQNCMLDVMKLWNEWQSLMKNKTRPSDPGDRRANFQVRLDTLFDIGAPDAIAEIMKSRLLSLKKKQDDIDFYNDQKADRRASMYGHDKVFETKAEMLVARHAREARIKECKETVEEMHGADAVEEPQDSDLSSENEDSVSMEDVNQDLDYHAELTEKVIADNFVTISMPKKIMQSDEIANAADRLKLSDNQVTMLVSAVIKASGGNLDEFDISTSTTRRSRMCCRQKLAEEVMDSFRQNPPLFAAVHWDGKLLRDLLGESHERLAVLLSGEPEYREGKLLGVPSLTDSKGKTQADATYDLLEAWDICDRVVALVFDTTASNSGVHKGAAKLLEERLNRKLLYLACRHHVLELVVAAVWRELFGDTVGPENTYFAQFKKAWQAIDKNLPIQTLTLSDHWLIEVREGVIQELTALLACD